MGVSDYSDAANLREKLLGLAMSFTDRGLRPKHQPDSLTWQQKFVRSLGLKSDLK